MTRSARAAASSDRPSFDPRQGTGARFGGDPPPGQLSLQVAADRGKSAIEWRRVRIHERHAHPPQRAHVGNPVAHGSRADHRDTPDLHGAAPGLSARLRRSLRST